MKLLSSWLNRSFIGYMLITYLVLMFIFVLMNQGRLPDVPIMILQVALAFIVFLCSFLYSSRSILTTCVIVFVAQLIMSFAIRFFYSDYYGNPLGYRPYDAANYDNIATMGYSYSFAAFNQFLDTYNVMLDDKGMFFISYLVYKLVGNPLRGIQLLVIVNAIVVTVSTYGIFKLSRIFFNQKISTFISFFWGTELYAAYTSAAGLKENFMVMFIIWAIFFIVSLYHNYSIGNLLLAAAFSSTALLFRMALFYMFIACLLFVTSLRFGFFRRYILFFLIIIVSFAAYKSYETINELAEMRGYSYEMLETIADGKMLSTWPMSAITNYVSAILGPFPNIIATGEKGTYITLYSFSSMCKVFYSFFFIYGFYIIIKCKKVNMMPLLIFWTLDSIMLIFTFFTLHDRYQWPHIPVFLIVSAYGACEWYNRKHKVKWSNFYLLVAISMIVLFNFR